MNISYSSKRTNDSWWSDPDMHDTAWRLARLGCWEWHVETDEVVWSSEMFDIYAASQDSFAGNYAAFLRLVHRDDRAHVESAINTALQMQQPYNIYHRLEDVEEPSPVIHAHGQPIVDENDKVIRLYGTAQDVTALKQSEAELTRQSQQLAALTNLGQTVTATHDLAIIFQQVVQQVAMLIDADHVLLFRCEGDTVILKGCSESEQLLNSTYPKLHQFIDEMEGGLQPTWMYGDNVSKHLPKTLSKAVGYSPQAVLIAPVLVQDEQLGFLMALANNDSAFGNEGLQVIEAAAGWAAIALANSQKHDALQEKVHELEVILKISQLITETTALDEILPLIVESANEMVCQADWSVIHLYNQQDNVLEAVHSCGMDLSSANYTLKPDEGIVGRVYSSGQHINVADLSKDERSLPFEITAKSRSLLVVPLKNREQFLGTISVHCSESGMYSESDERLLNALGLQACIAIQNGHIVHELGQRQQQLQRLSQQIVTAQEEERRRVARDLHDDVGQILTALRIGLGLADEELLLDGSNENNLAVKNRLDEAISLADEAVMVIRNITYDLRPPSLTSSGLIVAVDGLCQSFERQTNILVEFQGDNLPKLSDNTNITIYRIIQEALTNVARHAEATNVVVNICYTTGCIHTAIEDNGKGFLLQVNDFPQVHRAFKNNKNNLGYQAELGGIGLIGMHERCMLLGGTFNVQSGIDKGTRISFKIPVEDKQ